MRRLKQPLAATAGFTGGGFAKYGGGHLGVRESVRFGRGALRILRRAGRRQPSAHVVDERDLYKLCGVNRSRRR